MNGARLFLSLLVVSFPAAALTLVRRTGRPKEWAVVDAICLGAGFVLLEASLIHASLPLVFTLLGQDELAAACKALGGHLFGAAPAFGAAAGSLAILIAVRTVTVVVWTVRNQVEVRRSAAMVANVPIAGQRTALLPLPGHSALAVPGANPLVLLSADLVHLLGRRELTAVVRHEAAHLHHHHVRFLLLGAGVASGLWFLPWMPRCMDSLRLGLERWADEEASQGSLQRRRDVRAALAKLAGAGPSRWAHDRIKALEGSGVQTGSARGWRTAVSAIVPLALGLAITLGLHFVQLMHVVEAAPH
ncbi:MAG: hypothetical protein WB239_14280 [Acidimicrobiia bacterium]